MQMLFVVKSCIKLQLIFLSCTHFCFHWFNNYLILFAFLFSIPSSSILKFYLPEKISPGASYPAPVWTYAQAWCTSLNPGSALTVLMVASSAYLSPFTSCCLDSCLPLSCLLSRFGRTYSPASSRKREHRKLTLFGDFACLKSLYFVLVLEYPDREFQGRDNFPSAYWRHCSVVF